MNKLSSIEVSEVPEWLVQLEKRREKLTKGKLGHESGAGAPCNVCGKSCPGLDLHFWRKVCRNCKCRKEQHNCPDDDLTGWAQFEILGQTRSQSAYINISQFAEKPIKLDWVPPNVDPDLVSDYMTQLGSTHIPITGSEAATKRKQQLEYQVPLHDLDATLCHNLSENEQTQLQQYVEKLKDNCVGQGMVTRVMPSIPASKNDPIYHDKASNFASENTNDAEDDPNTEQRLLLNQRDLTILKQLGYERDAITLNMCTDPIVKYILNSESIEHLLSPTMYAGPFTKPLSCNNKPLIPDFMQTPYLSDKNKLKLKSMKIDTKTIKAGVMNGPFYDKMFNRLDGIKSNYSSDSILMPLKEFRKEYLKNEPFKKDMNNFMKSITGDNQTDDNLLTDASSLNENLNEMSLNSSSHQTPPKHGGKQSNRVSDTGNADSVINEFHSPIPVKAAWTVNEDGGRLLNQETPMRKIQFNKNLPSTATTTTTVPQNDQFLARIYNSNAIQNALNDDRNYGNNNNNNNRDIILTDVPMKCDFDNCSKTISDENHKKLQNMNVNTMAICSSVISGPIYDKLFQDLDDKNYNIQKCGILQPIRQFRKEYKRNPSFRNDIQCSDILAYADLLNVIDGANAEDHDDNVKTSDGKKHVIPSSSASVPVPVFKCKHCELNIMSGEVAVKAERAGKGIVWHPKCFVCHCCGELLVDLVYFYHNGNVYCGRDLANILNIPRCQACDELIFTKEYTAAEDSTFHIKHFCCYQCDVPLAGKRYVPDDKVNQPLCLPCFDQFHAARCERCLLMIRPDEQGVSYGKLHWHGTCFMCFGVDCGKSLIGGKFCFKKNLVFCSPNCVASVQ